MPSEAELKELLRAAEGRPVPPPRVFAGDASLCPALNPAGGGGGAGGSAAILQSLARATADGGGGGATLLGYDRGRPVYADAAEEVERELAALRWAEEAARKRGAQPPPESATRKAELKRRLKELNNSKSKA